MRALLDTNVIIHRENTKATSFTIGKLFYWLDKLRYEKLIHPYANKIFDGQKHYEYRKRIPKKEVSKIVVYSSAPEQAVIGEVEVVKTLKMKPTPLWNSTKANAGISRLKYREYFSGCTTAYAFALGSFKRYETSKSLADFNIQSAPQSFVYLDD